MTSDIDHLARKLMRGKQACTPTPGRSGGAAPSPTLHLARARRIAARAAFVAIVVAALALILVHQGGHP
jgi:hypothetical protein